MITWLAITQIVVAICAAFVCLWVFLRGRAPNDYSLGATLLVGLFLIVQVIVSIVGPFVGNAAKGDPLEYWMYLIVALLLPFVAGIWALIDRRRSANFVLIVVALAVAIMTYRMLVVWG